MPQAHCANCAAKSAKARDLLKAASALHDQMQDCAKAGHPSTYADAQEQGASATRSPGYGDYVAPAAQSGKASAANGVKKNFYGSASADLAGGLTKAS